MRELAVITRDALLADLEQDVYPGTVRYVLHAIGRALIEAGLPINLIALWENGPGILVGVLVPLDTSEPLRMLTEHHASIALNNARPAGVLYKLAVVRGDSLAQSGLMGGRDALEGH